MSAETLRFPQPLWNVENFPVENCLKKSHKNALWKTKTFPQKGCGKISFGAVRKNLVFHIKILYCDNDCINI